ncbi:nuclear transport factor 2 family protein [Mycolicibacterium sp.]|uniref:nuclear transport factor 2 family protein n=1 Tax=Mycolicibacterium sp. TaxID=2320850 RepID=UPI0037C563F1
MQYAEVSIRESVRQTLADYTAATDGFDLHALAECFAQDGVLEFTGAEQPLVGPAAIESGLRAAISGPRDPGRRVPTHVRHHVSSVRFTSVGGERVGVSSYFAVHTDIGLDHWGRYRDVLVERGERWLFAHRKISVDGFSPASLMAD